MELHPQLKCLNNESDVTYLYIETLLTMNTLPKNHNGIQMQLRPVRNS